MSEALLPATEILVPLGGLGVITISAHSMFDNGSTILNAAGIRRRSASRCRVGTDDADRLPPARTARSSELGVRVRRQRANDYMAPVTRSRAFHKSAKSRVPNSR